MDMIIYTFSNNINDRKIGGRQMLCEVCGREIERLISAEIEGVSMKVCSGCAKFGTSKPASTPKPSFGKPKTFSRGPSHRPKQRELEALDDFASIIRNARERKGMKREDLGRAINEKESVIARLESGAMVPDTKLARKIERALGVKILGVLDDGDFERSDHSSGGMTIGDLIK
jgi:putative transcription factor